MIGGRLDGTEPDSECKSYQLVLVALEIDAVRKAGRLHQQIVLEVHRFVEQCVHIVRRLRVEAARPERIVDRRAARRRLGRPGRPAQRHRIGGGALRVRHRSLLVADNRIGARIAAHGQRAAGGAGGRMVQTLDGRLARQHEQIGLVDGYARFGDVAPQDVVDIVQDGRNVGPPGFLAGQTRGVVISAGKWVRS